MSVSVQPAVPPAPPAHAAALAVARQCAEAAGFADFLTLCRQIAASFADDLVAQLDVGALLAGYGFLTDARLCYAAARRIDPADSRAIINLANLARDGGDPGEASRLYAELLLRFADQPVIRRNALISLEYDPAVDDAARLAQAKAWGEWALAHAGGKSPRPPMLALGTRPLRVGYVSADLCQHTVGLFARDVLKTHDPARVAARVKVVVASVMQPTVEYRDGPNASL